MQQTLQGAVIELPAVAQHHDPGAEGGDVFHVVGCEKNGGLVLQVFPFQEIPEGQLADRVQADGGLVQEERPRLMQQGAAELRPHPLAQAQLAQGRPQQIPQVQRLRKLLQPFLVCRIRNPVDILQEAVAVQDGHVPPELHPLAEDHADALHVLLPVFPGDLAAHPRFASVRRQDAGKDFDGGGFARAVGADVSDQLSLLDVKGYVLQGPDRFLFPQKGAFLPFFAHTKTLAQMLNMNKAHAESFPAVRGRSISYSQGLTRLLFAEAYTSRAASVSGCYCIRNGAKCQQKRTAPPGRSVRQADGSGDQSSSCSGPGSLRRDQAFVSRCGVQ